MGFVGKVEGCAANAVVLLIKKNLDASGNNFLYKHSRSGAYLSCAFIVFLCREYFSASPSDLVVVFVATLIDHHINNFYLSFINTTAEVQSVLLRCTLYRKISR
jgi:hypothetical protein